MARNWVTVKVPTGRFLTPIQVCVEEGRIHLKFGYNAKLVEAMKDFGGRKWHGYEDPPEKIWSFPDNSRNRFRFDKLCGKKVFANWDAPIEDFEVPERHLELPFWSHQKDLYNEVLQRKQLIIVGEMGVGKSRVAVAAAEYVKDNYGLQDSEFMFVGPVNAVNAVGRELRKWDCPIDIDMFTYDKLVSHLKEYEGMPPRFLIIDEASKLKNWQTQRTKAVWHLTEAMREEYGDDCWIIQMSGTPAPKSPVDWWSLAEIARPGFLREPTVVKLRNNLCVIEERENASGGMYPHIVGWLDNPDKCKVCCKLPSEHGDFEDHTWSPSVNQLQKIYQRLKGLVVIKLMSECMDLPEMQVRIIRLKPSMTAIRAAKIIRDSSERAPQKLMLIRELSDGFQYKDVAAGEKQCPRCLGAKKVMEYVADLEDDVYVELEDRKQEEIECPFCEGEGVVTHYESKPVYVDTPKDAYLDFLLDEYSEYGRFVVWGAFTATLDRITNFCVDAGWAVLRIDGSGVTAVTGTMDADVTVADLMDCMDYSNKRHADLLRSHPKVVVVAHPKSGGMSYTFTSAPAQLYYGNDFNAEDKMQSAARIRRGGMHMSRGVTTYEIVHLPEDKMVIDNLEAKKDMQAVTLNDLTGYKVDYSNMEMFDGEKYV